ncbi:PD-(D/E)XK nuclease family protein [Hydrocarboniphaga effusa]|uniref:PD-(D/E)XK nuclease family protein n=1 Tax=Hydrocarboniphaga effusa TaxID=243629 RepID=UPI003137D419
MAENLSFANKPDTLTLTASDRLARALREDHSLQARGQGAQVWEAPAIQSLRQWMQDAWTASWPIEQLLHSTQELALWRDAVQQDVQGAALLAPLSAAREARRAEQLVARYELSLPRPQSEDHQAFARWRAEFRDRLQRRGWLVSADLPAQVIAAVRAGRIRAPQRIVLAGFGATLAPSERSLFAALEAAGSRIERWQPPRFSPELQRLRHADAQAQFRAIGADIRRRLMPFADHSSPPPRIVIAMPDPDGRRELLESIFRPLLAPWLQGLEASHQRPQPWRWEAGGALADQPPIAAALALAELRPRDNAPDLVGRVLLSSALWDEFDRGLGARAEARLRDEGWPRISFERLTAALPERLQARYLALRDAIAAAPSRALPSAWSQHWQQRLRTVQGPWSPQSDSAGFQLYREWERLLARFSSMDAQLAQVSAGEALSWLRELARSARFDARVEYTQPVLILRLDEAMGLPCDVLYLADLSADGFPGRPRGGEAHSDYLPLDPQIAAGVPGAAPALLLARSRELAAELLTLAPEVSLHVVAFDERGAQVTPSPLFGTPTDWVEAPALAELSGLDRRTAQGPQCTRPADDPVPAVGADELGRLRAGAALFQAWFESPFFAFARSRLGIEALREPSRWLDAARQGHVAHAVLEAVWGELRSSAELARRSDEEIATAIAAALDPALDQHMPPADYGRVPVALERARQADVLGQWMRHERRRLDPFSVEHIEAEVEMRLAGLPLKLRIDRIDRVRHPDGDRWLVLDYKTGRNADPRGWSADRLAEPQLPLYASHAAAEVMGVPRVDGICFGHLKDGHPTLSALTDWRQKLIEGELQDLRDDWANKLSDWRQQLIAAARGFLAGEAGIGKVNARSFYADLLLFVDADAQSDEDES